MDAVLSGIPLSLYVHMPWCIQKCPYCDFNSHQLDGKPIDEARYIALLLDDLAQELPRVWGRKLHSIFIGGGTPSLFSAASIDQLLSGIRALLPVVPALEVTLEANPGATEKQRLKGFQQAGVNRISIGVQSFNDVKLKQLGRVHSRQEAISAIESAHAAGFNSINIDLMFGLAGQTIEQAMEDLKLALTLQTQHLSWYQLTIEPNTVFHRFPPTLPPEPIIEQIQQQGLTLMQSAGFEQYEISAYRLQQEVDVRCQHNLNYWRYGDYLGIGAGAHGKISHLAQNRIVRTRKVRQPSHYMKKGAKLLAHESEVNENQRPFEFMLNAMRLNQGVPVALFQQRTGINIDQQASVLQQAQQLGLLLPLDDALCPTAKGLRFHNDLVTLFLP